MTDSDIDEFFVLLDEVYDLMGKTPSAKIISAGAKAMFFRAVAHQSLADVRNALDHHASTGTFTPVPKDINEFIAASMPVLWIGADEAWAQIPKLESDTGLLNQVTSAALAKAQPLIDAGDMIAARRAFIDAYDRLVSAVKIHIDPAQRVPIAWVSGGNNPQRFQDPHGERMMVLEQGRAAGLLPAPKQPEPVPQLGHSIPPAGALEALQGFRLKTLPPPEVDHGDAD